MIRPIDARLNRAGGYNQTVFRLLPYCLASLLVLAACGNDMKTKEKVQAAILERLQARSGLDLKSMDVATTNVSFEGNLAHATVRFRPKDDPKTRLWHDDDLYFGGARRQMDGH